ncbi:MAG: hypothetical protein A2430_01665 [Candidatus Liptonbacteria bacterium RIFOXYC1_FULL_36_8]|uniref:PrgI family protein n=2 Tax=Candidatus Liptoniibacteriota TaxID=1817909 RepID=A0A1G2CP66_9BACT|nr:MAG: hypothetical protein A2390_01010 [Candidatus Liptonbacteria bacterium RIFOXYB1_FULL_36_10]OGZ03902.1 MAG: hypothetical protein A2430_01665 [Candidatus Liptonbacteria bacterium RIFOXYC1_FULL_36_8]
MVFQVPQFIDIEDKIVGPLTLKQFAWIAGAFLLSLGFFYIFVTWLWLFFTIILAGLAGGFSFIKIGGRGLAFFLFSALEYYWRPRMYFWQHEILVPVKVEKRISSIKELPVFIPKTTPSYPKIVITKKPELTPSGITSGSGLKNLSEKMLITKTAIINREKASFWFNRGPRERYEVLEKLTGDRVVAKRIDYR